MSKDEKGALISVGSGSIGGSASAITGIVLGASEGAVGAAAMASGLSVVGSVRIAS